MLFEVDDNLSPLEKWLALKDIESVVKAHLTILKEEVEELASSSDGKVVKVFKETVKPKDSIIKFLEDKDLLRLVKKDDIDMMKVNQLVDAGVITEEELENHLDRKLTSYLKKGKK